MALSLIVLEFAGYGYRRVTHALKRSGGPGQSQACLARDARRVAVVPLKTAICANDRLASSLSGLSQSISDDGTDGSQSGLGGSYNLHSLAQLFCLLGVSAGCVFTALCRMEVVKAYRYRAGFRGSGHGVNDTHYSTRSDSPLRSWGAVCQHSRCGTIAECTSSDQYVSGRKSV
jgi:hypothetical protein